MIASPQENAAQDDEKEEQRRRVFMLRIASPTAEQTKIKVKETERGNYSSYRTRLGPYQTAVAKANTAEPGPLALPHPAPW